MMRKIVLMDFSGAYAQQSFWKDQDVSLVDVRNLSGTNCYCDREAVRQLQQKIRDLPVSGIHFLDSGNYHYMSRIWLEKISEPFRLLIFDNHTDMQPPAFGDLLSCGGWAASALWELPALREVVLVGPDADSFCQAERSLRDRVRFLSREELRGCSGDRCRDFWEELPMDLPYYISVDKDILCPEAACTEWSQGDLRLEELTDALESFLRRCEGTGQKLLGADICGECAGAGNAALNEHANRALLELFSREDRHEE